MTETDDARAADHAGVAFPPPILLAASLAIGFLLRWVAPLSFLPESLSSKVGPVVVVLAFGIVFWSVFTMHRNGASIPTSKPTDAIVVRGPFRFSRNPIYFSMVLLILGAGIWSNSLWFVVLVIKSVALLTWGVISREERYLEGKFGEEYASYKSRVRRWF